MKRLPLRDLRPAFALLLSAFFLALVILPVPVFAARVSRATTASRVRIGVVRPALAQDVANALFSQQTAYLIELSKYTDWDFDVIELSPEEVGDALLAGQIDLAMPMELHIHDTEHFASSRPTALRDLIGLYSRPGDDRFAAADQDLAVLESARIGLVESRPDLLAPFEKFCQDNGLSVTSVSFASDPEAHAALADGTIDLLLDAATASDEQESFVIALDSMPMAIAGLRQNSGLLGVIDDANAALEAQSPRFSELARQQFEDRTRRLVTHFTPAEQQLIESLPTLHVVLAQDDADITLDREILSAVCKSADISIDFLTAANASEARTMVEDGKADLLLDIYTPNSDTTGLYYTDPVYTQEYILVGRDGAYVPKKGAIATPSLQPSFIDAVRQRFPDWTVLPTPDEQHALAAVSNGRTNLALSSVVSMQATRNLILYPNLVLVPSENRILIGTSLAISSREPRLLQSVFNKALLRLDPQEKERILLKNEIRTPPHFSLSYFVTFYPLQTGLLMGGILLLICLAPTPRRTPSARSSRSASASPSPRARTRPTKKSSAKPTTPSTPSRRTAAATGRFTERTRFRNNNICQQRKRGAPGIHVPRAPLSCLESQRSLFIRAPEHDLREDQQGDGKDGEAEVFGRTGEVFADEGERSIAAGATASHRRGNPS